MKYLSTVVLVSLFFVTNLFATNQKLKSDDTARVLSSNWQYIWGDPQGFLKEAGTVDPVLLSEAAWNSEYSPGVPPRDGHTNIIWYRVLLPAGKWSPPYILIPVEIAGELEVFFKGDLIYHFQETPQGIWIMFRLPDQFEGEFLYFRVASAREEIGIFNSVWIGPQDDLIRVIIHMHLGSFLTSFVLLIMGIGAVVIFIINRNDGRRRFLYYSIFTINAGLLILARSGLSYLIYPDYQFWSRLSLMMLFLIPVSFPLSSFEFFKNRYKSLLLIYSAISLFFIAALYILDLTGFVPLQSALVFFNFAILIAGVFWGVISVRFIFDQDKDTKIFAAGFFLMVIYGIINTVSSMKIIPYTGGVLHWGLLLYNAAMAAILIRTMLLLGKRFQEINIELERKVKEHAVELKETFAILEAKQNEMFLELEMARRIQQHLIPESKSVNIPDGVGFAARYVALESVGGDLYDLIRVGRNAVGFLIMDVSGHGVPAAMVTMMAKVNFQLYSRWGNSPAKVISQVNNDLIDFIGDLGFFLTAFYGILNLETQVLEFANAGHPPAIIIRKRTGDVELLEATGTVIGCFPNPQWKTVSLNIEPGDKVILYTDGITESRNSEGEMYGLDSLIESCTRFADKPLDDFIVGVSSDLIRFCWEIPLNDDRCILCFNYSHKAEKK